ncbi:hypothetical protein DKX38_010857 [Salix brachista]|uniref:DUF659 domain-containing protein n=1 Tax=Salix brachista TaxID=2182728 RepID=A0A5N5LZG6_9ROSI|nr:hypothetical protein DKX38_010857 [Salix brachista]
MTAGEVSINIYDHGVALDEKKQRVQCNYCGKVMSGFSRLKYHVGGIRGDVVPCEKVAVNVRESFRSMLLETKRASLDKEVQDPYHPDLPCKRFYSPDLNAAKRKKRDVNHTTGCGSGMHAEMHSVMEDDMTEHVSVNNRRTAMSSGAKENVLSRQAQRCIGRFFYETGFDFSASTLPSFQRMINATLDDGQSEYKVPSLQDLKGWILHDEVEEMKTYVKEISRSWASTGCSVLLDGWVDEKGRNLISFVVECPGGPTYLRSADVSAIIDDPSKMKLAMPFFTLENIVSEKKNLEEMFDSSEWKTSVWSSTVEGKRVADLVGDHSFWNQHTQLKITFQLDDYRHARGAFEEGKAIDKRTNISPVFNNFDAHVNLNSAQWWCTYGKQCPELQRFAVRILSQTCDGASRYGLKRSMAEKILADRRNPIEQKRLRDMAFVHYNLQVQNKRFGSRSDVTSEEIDPLDDWVVDEAPREVVPENGDRGLMDSECSEETDHKRRRTSWISGEGGAH